MYTCTSEPLRALLEHTMELTRKYKMAYYLMRNRETYDKLVVSIQNYKGLPLHVDLTDKIRRMLRKYSSEKFVDHPEILIHIMWSYLTRDVAWNVVVYMLKKLDPDFQLTDLDAHDLEKLSKHDCGNLNLKASVRGTLESLKGADVRRVKLLLSWEIIEGYDHVRYGRIETMSIWDLADHIVSTYFDHAVFVMSLILAQIEQMDLVVTLTKATG